MGRAQGDATAGPRRRHGGRARDETARSRSSVAPVVTSTAFSTVDGAHIMNAASRSTPSDFEHSGDPRVS